ncbi:hypothetical protein SNEBB_001160 [Seison nebaliae]|nr:hypothetical protein SNEBB_001160 [Seison nebaliae]
MQVRSSRKSTENSTKPGKTPHVPAAGSQRARQQVWKNASRNSTSLPDLRAIQQEQRKEQKEKRQQHHPKPQCRCNYKDCCITRHGMLQRCIHRNCCYRYQPRKQGAQSQNWRKSNVSSDGFRRPTKRNTVKPTPIPETAPIKTSNKFAVLEEQDEMVLISDSQLQGLGQILPKKQRTKRAFKCLPGLAKTKEIQKKVETLKINSDTVVTAQVSGNDFYQNGRKLGERQTVTEKAEGLVNAIKKISSKAMIIGLIPRQHAMDRSKKGCPFYALNEVNRINQDIRKLCIKENVWFVNPFNIFKLKPHLFRDEYHLNNTGRRALNHLLRQSASKMEKVFSRRKEEKDAKDTSKPHSAKQMKTAENSNEVSVTITGFIRDETDKTGIVMETLEQQMTEEVGSARNNSDEGVPDQPGNEPSPGKQEGD